MIYIIVPTARYSAHANKGRLLGCFCFLGFFFKNCGDGDVISVLYLSWDLRGV